MSEVKRVVSIGAHSLDAELMGGPLFIKYAEQGAKCTLLHVTRGRLEDPNATEEEKEEYLNSLTIQNNEAAKTLGADWQWLGYLSNNMPSLDEFSKKLEEYFVREKVDLVITHWRGSMHQRHINTHDAVTLAVKRMHEGGSHIRLMYGETFEDLIGFIPQAYFELDEREKNNWFEALKKYDVFNGLVNDFPYLPYYTTNGRVRQIESNSKAFTVCYMYASLIENRLW